MSLREACKCVTKEKFDDELSLFFLEYMKQRIERAIFLDEPTVTFDVGEGESSRWNEKLRTPEISRRVRIIGHFLEEIKVPYTYSKSCGTDSVITVFTHHLFL